MLAFKSLNTGYLSLLAQCIGYYCDIYRIFQQIHEFYRQFIFLGPPIYARCRGSASPHEIVSPVPDRLAVPAAEVIQLLGPGLGDFRKNIG